MLSRPRCTSLWNQRAKDKKLISGAGDSKKKFFFFWWGLTFKLGQQQCSMCHIEMSICFCWEGGQQASGPLLRYKHANILSPLFCVVSRGSPIFYLWMLSPQGLKHHFCPMNAHLNSHWTKEQKLSQISDMINDSLRKSTHGKNWENAVFSHALVSFFLNKELR